MTSSLAGMAKAAVDRPPWQLVASKRGVLQSLFSDLTLTGGTSIPLARGRVPGSFVTYLGKQIVSTKLLCYLASWPYLATHCAVIHIFSNTCSMGKF